MTITEARERWDGVRKKYLKENHFDIGEGRLIAVLGMKT